MTLEQLRIFVAVAERQHVTRAAEALNLAQSAASAAIASIEAHYGVKLFHRVGRGIELTDVGRSFLPEAQAAVARMQAAELALSDLAGLKRGTLSLQASHTIASYWLPPAHRRLPARLPRHRGQADDRQQHAGRRRRPRRSGGPRLRGRRGRQHGSREPRDRARPAGGRRRSRAPLGGPATASRPARSPRATGSCANPDRERASAFEAALERMDVRADDLRVVQELPSNEGGPRGGGGRHGGGRAVGVGGGVRPGGRAPPSGGNRAPRPELPRPPPPAAPPQPGHGGVDRPDGGPKAPGRILDPIRRFDSLYHIGRIRKPLRTFRSDASGPPRRPRASSAPCPRSAW